MSAATRSLDEIGHMALDIYHNRIQPLVMPTHKGKYLAIDIDSGDYEVDENDLVAERRLRERRPDGTLFGLKIGYRAAYSLGGRLVEEP
jgi:hypothetical protein